MNTKFVFEIEFLGGALRRAAADIYRDMTIEARFVEIETGGES